jgi:homoserine/homoserine lactone efflux protein
MNAPAHIGAAFALGMALGGAPGPVQVLLLAESSRGGLRRGLAVMVAANGTLAALGGVLALWLSGVVISAGFLRAVRTVGGLFLLYIGIETWRSAGREEGEQESARAGAKPATRGALAVLLNPGAFLFLATTGSAMLASASRDGGAGLSLLTLAGMIAGVSTVDFAMVLAGSRSHYLPTSWRSVVFGILGGVLVGIGALFLYGAIRG